MAGIKKCHDYSEMAANVYEQLTLAGFNAEYFEHVDIVTVTVKGVKYNVCPLPDIEQFGDIFIRGEIQPISRHNRLFIDLHYNDKITVIKCSRCMLEIKGYRYSRYEYYNRYHGYINGNMGMDYRNAWIKHVSELYNKYYEIQSPADIEEGDILNIDDFTPVKEVKINIKNEGFKYVYYNRVNENAIGNVEYFIEGRYIENKDGSILRYKHAESGELFALLIDPQSKEAVFAGETKQIKLTSAETCLIRPLNGLYNGFKIMDDITKLKCYTYNGFYTKFDGKLTVTPEPKVYLFNYILYGSMIDDEQVKELKVINPANGKHTKAAAVWLSTIAQ
jgi:hypothetical protein